MTKFFEEKLAATASKTAAAKPASRFENYNRA
jgi:hypothetical protein